MLKEHEAGGRVDELCRRHANSTETFYACCKKYAGMEASDTKRLRVLEAENAKLKRIVADRMLDMSAMKDLLGKRRSSQWPGDEPWAFFVDTLCLSGRRSCRIVGLSRSLAIHLAPWAEMFIVYLVLACVLAVRPQGIYAPAALRKI